MLTVINKWSWSVVRFVAIIPTILLVQNASAVNPELYNNTYVFSYGYGLRLAQKIQQEVKTGFDYDAFNQAIEDVNNGVPPKVNEYVIRQAFKEKNLIEGTHYERILKENREAATAFLLENKKREGVIEYSDTLQYEVLKSSTKEDAKQPSNQPGGLTNIIISYKAEFLDGTVFDTTTIDGVDEPLLASIFEVIPGWRKLLPLMKEGDKWRMYVGSAEAYGFLGQTNVVEPGQLIIFEIELLEVFGAQEEEGEKEEEKAE